MPVVHQHGESLVLWDMVDFPLPKDYSSWSFRCNVSESLSKGGFHGPLRIMAFGDHDSIPSFYDETSIAHIGDRFARLSNMILGMFGCTYRGLAPLPHPVHIMLIVKDCPQEDTQLFTAIQAMKEKNCNVCLVVPDDFEKLEYPSAVLNGTAVYEWSDLLEGKGPLQIEGEWTDTESEGSDDDSCDYGSSSRVRMILSTRQRAHQWGRHWERQRAGWNESESPWLVVCPPQVQQCNLVFSTCSNPLSIESMATNRVCVEDMEFNEVITKFADAKTFVYWDVVDYPVMKEDITSFDQNIKSALDNAGYHGEVSITAFGDDMISKREVRRYSDHIINFVPGASRRSRIHQMLVQIHLLFLKNDSATPTNLMILTKTILQEEEEKDVDFNTFVTRLTSNWYNVLLAVPDLSLLDRVTFPILNSVWCWDDLLCGGCPVPKNLIDEAQSRKEAREQEERIRELHDIERCPKSRNPLELRIYGTAVYEWSDVLEGIGPLQIEGEWTDTESEGSDDDSCDYGSSSRVILSKSQRAHQWGRHWERQSAGWSEIESPWLLVCPSVQQCHSHSCSSSCVCHSSNCL